MVVRISKLLRRVRPEFAASLLLHTLLVLGLLFVPGLPGKGPGDRQTTRVAAEAVELGEMVGAAQVRLHLDCKAMSTESLPIAEIVRRHGAMLAHFHANDPNRQGPGFGDVDFLPILQALGQIDYRGWVSVEVFDYTPGIERLARQSIEYLQQCLQELAE